MNHPEMLTTGVMTIGCLGCRADVHATLAINLEAAQVRKNLVEFVCACGESLSAIFDQFTQEVFS